jgi:hypothetical protein
MLHARSQRIGLRLYAMALLPTWPFSNGSSISFMFDSKRMSVHILVTDCATPLNVESTKWSSLRVYVCPVSGSRLENPNLRHTSSSSCSTLAWSPLNSCKYVACVPVVPLAPRMGKSSISRATRSKSMQKSCSHKAARLPTVTSCAGWKCV